MKRLSAIITILILFIGPLGVFADDTAIYDVVNLDIDPNVLIIFDTSGSMSTVDVPGDPYDPAVSYSGSYSANAVYRLYDGEIYLFADDITDIVCDSVREELLEDGGASARISSSTYQCGDDYWTRTLRIGNFLNYHASGIGDTRSRIEVAKSVIAGTSGILNDPKYADIRFGLMRFNYKDGGRFADSVSLSGCKDRSGNNQELVDIINDSSKIYADGATPLAETLAEAGVYFAGGNSWFNSDTSYTSPIDIPCRKNYVIIMTDGAPMSDRDCKLKNNLLAGETIGNAYELDGIDETTQSHGGYDSCTSDTYTYDSDWLNDVAQFLYDKDLRPNWPAEGESGYGDFDKQNIRTYTIGFTDDIPILRSTANAGTGTTDGSGYFTAFNYGALQNAFEDILSDVEDINAAFVAPVVPVSRTNQTLAGNALYVGFFKPEPSGRWNGNIKKFRLTGDGDLVEPDGETLFSDITGNPHSYWYDENCSDIEGMDSACGNGAGDGWEVTVGGAGGVMKDQADGISGTDPRQLYTYLSTSGFTAFNTTNITPTLLNVTTTTERNNIVNDMYGSGKAWVMGDVLHSRPLVVHYDLVGADGIEDTSFIYASTNGGVMHCIKDADGQELWGFIPQDHLPRLKNLTDSNKIHDYFVDGSPSIYEDDTQKVLLFGERRGGTKYYALNITLPSVPQWKYEVNENKLGGGAALLGQSWSSPKLGKIKTASGDDDWQPIFFLAGGYDTNQDSDTPIADTKGRAVFTIDARDGSISSLNFNAGNYSQMTHCIVDVTAVDTTGDGFDNRVYAGDMGGQVFAMEDDDAVGSWSKRKLFVAKSGETDPVTRKIFYAPDVTRESYGDLIFFGTGNRADPNDAGDTVVDRIYAVQNRWETSFIDGTDTMDERDLHDATLNWIQEGGETEQEIARNELQARRGWFIKLNPGEKVVSETVVFAGVVYFTTYEPVASMVINDCDVVRGSGIARLYALDYKTGAAVYWDWHLDMDGENVITEPRKGDRSIQIGTTMPSAPVIAVLEGGPQLFVASSGGGGGGGNCEGPICKFDPKRKYDIHLFYWWQQLSS